MILDFQLGMKIQLQEVNIIPQPGALRTALLAGTHAHAVLSSHWQSWLI